MFNVVDCASINPNLFESELFGHVKGAFTGAIEDKAGLFSATKGGTLFLDEIAEVPVNIQVKLLRAIEERTIRPVGSIQARKFDARIIAATSRDLREAVAKNEFREDLFYRLNVITLELPPLRERKDDIPLLINHFIIKLNGGEDRIKGVTENALRIMMSYDWPGNVREMYNCIERAFTLGTGEYIDMGDLPQSMVDEKTGAADEGTGSPIPLAAHEKEVILKTLEETKGNKTRSAKILGISLSTLYRKLERYGIG